jgi:hypothetical protein
MLKDKLSEHLSKGIAVTALRDLVKNTAPFIFSKELDAKSTSATRYVEVLAQEKTELTSIEYYEFCISAHFATVGTFVPTDVDGAIREKLWRKISTPEEFAPMWKLVQDFATWDESLVSRRTVITDSGKKLSGHQGEWLSIAMGAYGTAVKKVHLYVPEIRTQIELLVKEHEEALHELRQKFLADGSVLNAKNYLDGIAAVAHNLGDLDRMFDAWEIGELDVLKRRVYRCGHEDARQPREEFLLAGKIYKELLANENHRHFPLREPKCIRRSSDFLLNYGPFLDEWGARLVTLLNDGELREVAEALILGWKRLNPKSIYTSQGYSRALCGMMNAFPNKREGLENLLSPTLKKDLNETGLKTLMGISKAQFEKQWASKLNRLLASV